MVNGGGLNAQRQRWARWSTAATSMHSGSGNARRQRQWRRRAGCATAATGCVTRDGSGNLDGRRRRRARCVTAAAGCAAAGSMRDGGDGRWPATSSMGDDDGGRCPTAAASSMGDDGVGHRSMGDGDVKEN
uniref:Uncharacterized protein n=2 Tax=Oryza sativa subsp. japonica TaxID=39947 RepID=Q10KD6_ORYSJ|nr:hypothetical protein [Oryza sativa Japonica Group]ABF96335.1 hypothetical protein LOC_Os03g27050 [Oryza sativa Japonica Group]